MIVCLSTGAIYKWKKNINSLFGVCKKISQLDGVELMLTADNLGQYQGINNENIKWLRKLKHVTIHSPIKIKWNSLNENKARNILNLVYKIYQKVRAKAIIFHVTELPSPDILSKYNFKIFVENTTKKGNINLKKFASIIKKHEHGVCLDVSHTYTWSDKESLKYFKELKRDICEIHLSVSGGAHEHLPFSESNKNFKKSIKFLKNTKLPIVVESNYNRKNLKFLIKDLERQINFIKNLDS